MATRTSDGRDERGAGERREPAPHGAEIAGEFLWLLLWLGRGEGTSGWEGRGHCCRTRFVDHGALLSEDEE